METILGHLTTNVDDAHLEWAMPMSERGNTTEPEYKTEEIQESKVEKELRLQDPVSCGKYSKYSRLKTRNILRENVQAQKSISIKKGELIFVSTELPEGEQCLSSEEQMGFALCIVLEDVEPQNKEFKVQWYRQKNSNPNGSFTPGVLAGKGQTPWLDTISRDTIMLVGVKFRKGVGNLVRRRDLKKLAELPYCLYDYVPKKGLVRQEIVSDEDI